eukprot:TRINITY_DN7065_c0_g2_i1.p1 TRINITY_DN7065_c0_g2~~TRINITY_DN7065_c0_g2_i1.p1  ORF type:complete len:113 (+),score=17.36 TRINITY_DN7065_c0_g2_i1:51-341(+)
MAEPVKKDHRRRIGSRELALLNSSSSRYTEFFKPEEDVRDIIPVTRFVFEMKAAKRSILAKAAKPAPKPVPKKAPPKRKLIRRDPRKTRTSTRIRR